MNMRLAELPCFFQEKHCHSVDQSFTWNDIDESVALCIKMQRIVNLSEKLINLTLLFKPN